MRSAIGHGDIEMVEKLLEEGVGMESHTMNAALLMASKYGQREVAEMLLEKGASMEVQDTHGWTALMSASA